MAKHLHQQAGGNPAQGPEGKMANPTAGPGAGNDFPDGPDTAPVDADAAEPEAATDEADQDPAVDDDAATDDAET